jgi:hypothetical protein
MKNILAVLMLAMLAPILLTYKGYEDNFETRTLLLAADVAPNDVAYITLCGETCEVQVPHGNYTYDEVLEFVPELRLPAKMYLFDLSPFRK